MKYKITFILLILGQELFAQFSSYFILGQEFSKEFSLYYAKSFLITQVFNITEEITQFEVDPLTASSSGELTTLAYQCQELDKEGLILGFYGSYWNDAGVVYQGYAFKDLTKDVSVELLTKISEAIDHYDSYLGKDDNRNNIYFYFEDLSFIIYKYDGFIRIRIHWKNFDSEWTGTSFAKTKKRFEKYINK